MLRWGENPRDRLSGFRAAQLLPGVGPAIAGKMVECVGEGAFAALAEIAPPARAAADWPGFVALMRLIAERRAGWPAEIGEARQWYEPHLERLHEDARIRQGDLAQLEADRGRLSVARALPDRADPRSAGRDERRDSGRPAARRGLPHPVDDPFRQGGRNGPRSSSWNAVDGCVPPDLGTGTSEEIEEERRLLYVAMTRAKDHLILVTPQRFFTHGQPQRGDRHVYAARTRFIPNAILDKFEVTRWPALERRSSGARSASAAASVDLRARMRGMWR